MEDGNGKGDGNSDGEGKGEGKGNGDGNDENDGYGDGKVENDGGGDGNDGDSVGDGDADCNGNGDGNGNGKGDGDGDNDINSKTGGRKFYSSYILCRKPLRQTTRGMEGGGSGIGGWQHQGRRQRQQGRWQICGSPLSLTPHLLTIHFSLPGALEKGGQKEKSEEEL